MKKFFKDYGFAVILFVFMTVATLAYWHQTYSYTRSEAKMHQQAWEQQDQRTEFWNGMWENLQSEYQQLLIQFMGMVVFATYIAHKEEHNYEEIKSQLDELKEMLNK